MRPARFSRGIGLGSCLQFRSRVSVIRLIPLMACVMPFVIKSCVRRGLTRSCTVGVLSAWLPLRRRIELGCRQTPFRSVAVGRMLGSCLTIILGRCLAFSQLRIQSSIPHYFHYRLRLGCSPRGLCLLLLLLRMSFPTLICQ
eukprot:Rmarinus@m.22685